MEVFASQPGLVQTELNGRKLDHRKLSAMTIDISTKLIGKDARTASLCLQRPATDPTVAGAVSAEPVRPCVLSERARQQCLQCHACIWVITGARCGKMICIHAILGAAEFEGQIV